MILVLYPVKIISLISSQKWEIPWEKPPEHPQAELGLSQMWPKVGSNPQRWDGERFRALKISVHNLSDTGAAWIFLISAIMKCSLNENLNFI